MRKLILKCECGQRMQVPRGAIGRRGMCPNCGRTLDITTGNTSPLPAGDLHPTTVSSGKSSWWRGRTAGPTEEAKRLFGQAADLFHAGRYGEALALFDSLARQFPDNPDIETARSQCIHARRRGPLSLPGPEKQRRADTKLDAEMVKQLILDKMLHGATESVQLQAAEIAARMLGLFQNGQPEPPAPPVRQTPGDARNNQTADAASADPEKPAASVGTASGSATAPETAHLESSSELGEE